MDKTIKLGEEKISKLLLSFSLPAIVGMLVSAFYNVIDRIFIGQGVNSLGIAGITIGFPLVIIMMAFSLLVGIGATALISIRLGEKKRDEAEKILGNGVTLLIIISVAMTILGLLFLDPLLRIFGASAEVLPYAKDYMTIIILGSAFSTIGFGMNNMIRADGNPKMAMGTMLIGALLNVILAPIFIFIFKWGMTGAGLATILSQAVSAMWVLSYFISGKSSLKIRVKNLKPQLAIFSGIISIGMPAFTLQLANSLINVVLNKSLIIYGGDIAISAMGIITSIQTLMLMPVIGTSQGAQPIIGYNYGAKKYKRVKDTLKLAIIVATAIVLVGYIATRLFPDQFITLFNSNDKQLIAFGAHALTVYYFLFPVVGFQLISSNYFQAIGKMKPAMFLTLSRQILILIPAILILPKFYGLDGILYAGPLADLSSSVLTGIWLFKELNNLKLRHEERILVNE